MCKRIKRGFLSAQPTYALFSIRSKFPLASQVLYLVSTCLGVPRDLIKRRTSRINMVGARSGANPSLSVRPNILMIATELWCSAVTRSNWLHGDETARDLSRRVADWRRFSLWSNYDLFTKRLHVVVLGWPPEMRGNFESVFQGASGIQLQRHPMILHAYFARNLLLMTYDFLQDFSGPLYE